MGLSVVNDDGSIEGFMFCKSEPADVGISEGDSLDKDGTKVGLKERNSVGPSLTFDNVVIVGNNEGVVEGCELSKTLSVDGTIDFRKALLFEGKGEY